MWPVFALAEWSGVTLAGWSGVASSALAVWGCVTGSDTDRMVWCGEFGTGQMEWCDGFVTGSDTDRMEWCDGFGTGRME